MKAKAKTDFLHDQHGFVKAGDVREYTTEQAASVMHLLEPYETKVVRETPAEPQKKK